MEPKFILSKKILHEQYDFFKNLGLKISYSLKTNPIVADILFKESDSDFSIHNINEFSLIPNGKRIWFFSQAWSKEDLNEIFKLGIRRFVVDNEKDLDLLLDFLENSSYDVDLALRMKFKEHRLETGKYFVYGMHAGKVIELIKKLRENKKIRKLGIHIHRKSQNASEWNLKHDLEDSISGIINEIDFLNIGGGFPVEYKNYSLKVVDYAVEKIKEFQSWFKKEIIVEPGRFIAAPCIKLEAEIIQIYDNNIVINCSIYNSQLDTILTGIKLIVEGELKADDEGKEYVIKGNTPTRDDIFRYKVKLKNPKIYDKIVFLNAGAYNYYCEFCSLERLKTEIKEDF